MCLLKKTIQLAESASKDAKRDACKHVGRTERWLEKVIKGEIKDPSVRKIENLYNFLK